MEFYRAVCRFFRRFASWSSATPPPYPLTQAEWAAEQRAATGPVLDESLVDLPLQETRDGWAVGKRPKSPRKG